MGEGEGRVNFFLGTYASQEAIDTDDGSAYYRTYENFFVYAANGLKSDFNGHSNEHYRNVYGFVDSCWGPSRPWLHTGETSSNLNPKPNPNANANPNPNPNPNASPNPSPNPNQVRVTSSQTTGASPTRATAASPRTATSPRGSSSRATRSSTATATSRPDSSCATPPTR